MSPIKDRETLCYIIHYVSSKLHIYYEVGRVISPSIKFDEAGEEGKVFPDDGSVVTHDWENQYWFISKPPRHTQLMLFTINTPLSVFSSSLY